MPKTMKMSAEFGYYPSSLDLTVGDITITDLADLDQTVADILQSEYLDKDWIYAPPQGRTALGHEVIAILPFSSRVFGLPKTHEITHANCNGQEHLDFLVWILSFFTGMRLTTAEAGFVDATPIKPGKLTDLVLVNCTMEDALELAERLWQSHKTNPRMAKRLIAAIHALFLAQYPQSLSYERFIYLYTALDACFAMTQELHSKAKQRPNHAERLEWMCQQYGMPVPDWAAPQPKASEVSDVRNDTIHEGLFFGEPLGFAIYGGNTPSGTRNVTLQMQALTCRLIVAILGRPDTEYVKSAVNTRQRHALKL